MFVLTVHKTFLRNLRVGSSSAPTCYVFASTCSAPLRFKSAFGWSATFSACARRYVGPKVGNYQKENNAQKKLTAQQTPEKIWVC